MREPGPENGDFERLMRESYRLVYQVAYSVLGNAADAEEVAQDTFFIAYRKFDSLRDGDKFRPWVARPAWRLALNSGGARRGRWAGMEHGWQIRRPPKLRETQASEREFEVRLRTQVELLPEKLKAVVLFVSEWRRWMFGRSRGSGNPRRNGAVEAASGAASAVARGSRMNGCSQLGRCDYRLCPGQNPEPGPGGASR